jgi:hypothetical protein
MNTKNLYAKLFFKPLRLEKYIAEGKDFLNYVKDTLKPKNYKKFKKFNYNKQLLYLSKMKRYKNKFYSTNENDFFYKNFNPKKYYGKIFYGGLDLGINIKKLLDNQKVTEIHIVEDTDEVVKLIKPFIQSDKIKIYKGNPIEYIPDKNYDFMIWTYYIDYIYNKDNSVITQNYLRQKYTKK